MLFGGFIVSAPLAYSSPVVRLVFQAVVGLYVVYAALKSYSQKEKLIIYYLILAIYTTFQLYINSFRLFPADLNPFIAILIAISFKKYEKVTYKILKLIVVINLFAMLYESYFGYYLFVIQREIVYEPGRMQGLFAYSKEASYFLVSTLILFRINRENKILLYVLLMSSLLTGSRTSILPVVLIVVLDSLMDLLKMDRIKIIIQRYSAVTLVTIISIVSVLIYFNADNEYIYYRILNSFNFESSSQISRLNFWNMYINGISSFSMSELWIGNGTYLNHVYGNGAENTFLMLFSQVGVIGLMLILAPLIYYWFKNRTNYVAVTNFIIIVFAMQVGRYGIGWSDGILLWIYVFSLHNKGKPMLPIHESTFERARVESNS